MRNSVKTIVAHFAVFVAATSLFSASKTMIFGGANGWRNIEEQSGITYSTGKFGYDAVQLVTSTQETNDSTDLLLTFDNSEIRDSTGHYEIVSNSLSNTPDAVKGRGAAMSRGTTHGLSLRGNDRALFGQTGVVGSFTIEFWLNPSIAESGETVLSWRSSLNNKGYSQYQMISASFFNNHLQWKFTNIFTEYKDSEIVLNGLTNIIPRKWSRHTLTFDEESGLIEYCVDGRTEALRYITKTEHENGTVCYPVLGVKAKLDICPEYAGKIDNFRIDRNANLKDSKSLYATGNEKYKIDGGKLKTNPVMISHSAVLNSIEASTAVPAQTEVRFYVRSGDNCYGWNENFPAWKEVVPGEKITGVSGLYFQLAVELFPDGGGNKTPSVSEVKLNYTEQDDPLPPFSITATPGNGCVTLAWSHSVDDSAGGYKVYYGNRPGEYFGSVAIEGSSPINVGNTTAITLNGLKNGTIYYFAVSAYSKIDNRINGSLSKEVFARPSVRLGN